MNQTSRSFDFSLHYQRSVLARILQDEQFAMDAKKIVKIESFDTAPFTWIIKKILNEGVKTIPILIDVLKTEKKTEKISDDLRKAVAEELKLMLGTNTFDDAQYGIARIKEFEASQRVSSGLFNAATQLKAGGNIHDIMSGLKSVLAEEVDTDIQTANLVTTYKERFLEREEKVRAGKLIYIPTGIKALDEKLKGNQPGSVWSFFGDTNIGKSILAVNLGRAALFSGYKTWHVVLEDKFDMTMQRYDSAVSRTPYNDILFCNYTKQEREVIDQVFEILNKKREQCLYVSKIEEGCCMQHIEDEYKRLFMKYKFKPVVMIIDSPHCMEPTLYKETTRLNYKQIYLEIRKFSRRENVAMYLLDQSKQEVKDKVAGTRASSESYDKARIVDGFITINQTKLQRKEGIIELFVAKMKDNEKNFSVFVRPKFSIMRYDSIEG